MTEMDNLLQLYIYVENFRVELFSTVNSLFYLTDCLAWEQKIASVS